MQDSSYMAHAHLQSPTHIYPFPSQITEPHSAQIQQAPYHPYIFSTLYYPQTTLISQTLYPHRQR